MAHIPSVPKLIPHCQLSLLTARIFFGVKPTLTFLSGFNNFYKARAKIGLETRAQRFAGTLTTEIPNPVYKEDQSTKINASGVVGDSSCGFAVGAEIDANVDKLFLEKTNGSLTYTNRDIQITGFLKRTLSTKPSTSFGFSVYQKPVNGWNNLVLGGELTHTLNAATVFAVGGQVNPDPNSTLKLRVTSAGSLGFSLTQYWGGPFTLTLLGEALKAFSGDNSLTWGVKINLK